MCVCKTMLETLTDANNCMFYLGMTEEGREGTLYLAGVSVHLRGFLYTPGSINRPKKALSIPSGPHYNQGPSP